MITIRLQLREIIIYTIIFHVASRTVRVVDKLCFEIKRSVKIANRDRTRSKIVRGTSLERKPTMAFAQRQF